MDPLAHDLDRLADHLLEQALAAPDKRATLKLELGRVRLSWASDKGDHEIEALPGMLVRIPDAKHRVEALEPSVMLLTAVSLPGSHAH
ncbi:hypothetical protein GCM10009792_19000 [Microcella alkalica]|uniref:Uncharacterized protein n=1 Tax=Microcella alkalica TaxID=355930 RepID=A0A839EBU3_9MICO|nr:hypothetical protein [Microcella alkalica]MBA8848676.1 hypothetical protein [Microcella alkalica]